MEKYCRCAGRAECCGYIMSYLTCLSYSGYNYFSSFLMGILVNKLNSLVYCVINRDIANTIYFTVDDIPDFCIRLIHKCAKILYSVNEHESGLRKRTLTWEQGISNLD